MILDLNHKSSKGKNTNSSDREKLYVYVWFGLAGFMAYQTL